MPPYRPKISRVGEKVRVELRNHWRDALVVMLELGLHLTRYDEFPDTDDEWGDPEWLRENH